MSHTAQQIPSPTRFSNLVAALRAQVERHPEKSAYLFHPVKGEPVSYSYAELDTRARALAVQLEMCADPGDPILILCQPGLDYIASFFACLYAHMKAVPLYPPRNNRHIPRLLAITKNVGAKTLLTTSAVQEKINQLDFDEQWYTEMTSLRVDKVSNELADYWEEGEPDAESIAFLQYTSGSTGTPKGVMVSHANLCHNIEVIGRFLPEGEDLHIVSWLPPYHDMGLIGCLLQSAYHGHTGVTLPPEAFIQRPLRWLELIAQYPNSASAAPNFALDHCVDKVSDAELATLDLSGWRRLFCGSEPIRHTTVQRFQQRFAATGLPDDALLPCYGLAEGTLMVSCHRPNAAVQTLGVSKGALEEHRLEPAEEGSSDCVTLVASGGVAGDQGVVICHPEHLTPLAEGEVGEVWVCGGSVAQGYWQNPEATDETFRATSPTAPGVHFMRTGDLGFFDRGQLYITGRIKDLMILNGKNHYPQDIEYSVTQAHAALVTDGCAAFTLDDGAGERAVVVAEVKRTERKGDLAPVELAIREAVAREHNVALAEVVLIAPASLPKTSSGKIQRARARQLYRDGELARLDTTPATDVTANNQERAANDALVDELIAWVRNYAETRINSRLIDERRCIPPHIALDFGEQGLLGMQIPKQYGGLGLNNEQALRLVEQLSAIDITLAAFVGLNNSLGIRPILNHASEEVKAELLPRLANGRMLASFAITEPGAGSNPRALASSAERQLDGSWLLNGEKSWIGTSAWAGVISVFAKSGSGITGFAVLQGSPGLRMGPEELTMGVRGMVQNSVLLENAHVDGRYILGEEGKGMAIAQETMSMTRLGFGAIGLGGMRRCAQLMARYAGRRTISSGRLLENSVTLQRLNLLTQRIHALDHYVWDLVRTIDRGVEVPEETLMVCKVLGTEYLFDAADDAMQMLGGRGYIETNLIPQLFRDARLTRIFEGPTETLQMHIGSGIFHTPEPLLQFIERDCHAPQVAAELAPFIATLRLAQQGQGQLGLDQLKDQQWTYYQLGEVVQWALLRAVLSDTTKPDGDTLHRRTLAWVEAELTRAMQATQAGSGRLPWETAQADLEQAIAGYTGIIGDLEQQASGELAATDALLRREQRTEVVGHGTGPRTHLDNAELRAVREWVGSWLGKHLRLDESLIHAETHFSAVGLDSIQAAELMMDLGDAFGIDIDMSAAWDYPTIATLSAAVVELRAANQESKLDPAVNG